MHDRCMYFYWCNLFIFVLIRWWLQPEFFFLLWEGVALIWPITNFSGTFSSPQCRSLDVLSFGNPLTLYTYMEVELEPNNIRWNWGASGNILWTWWEHIGNKLKNKQSPPPTPQQNPKPGLTPPTPPPPPPQL
jgi:hypothetical protein